MRKLRIRGWPTRRPRSSGSLGRGFGVLSFWQGLVAKAASYISDNRLLSAGIALLIVVLISITVPPVRDFWYQTWGDIFGQPAPGGIVSAAQDNASCVNCHQARVDQLMARANQHLPFREQKCLDCHVAHPASADNTISVDPNNRMLLRMSVDKVCSSCHDTNEQITKQLQMSSVHIPFKNGWCTGCHDPHASDQLMDLKLEPAELCLSCHNMNLRYGQAKVKHPPYQQNACLGCHVPHASNNTKNTRLAMPYLCMNCHPTVAQAMNMAVLHPPFSQAMCTMCHNPHGSDYPRMAKAPVGSTQPFADLCLQCHSMPQARVGAIDLHKSHRVYGPIPDPLTGQPVSCISCHQPHGSNNPRMWLRDKDFLCLGCHRLLPGRFTMPW